LDGLILTATQLSVLERPPSEIGRCERRKSSGRICQQLSLNQGHKAWEKLVRV